MPRVILAISEEQQLFLFKSELHRKDVLMGLAELSHEGESCRPTVMGHKQGCLRSRPGDNCPCGQDGPVRSGSSCTAPSAVGRRAGAEIEPRHPSLAELDGKTGFFLQKHLQGCPECGPFLIQANASCQLLAAWDLTINAKSSGLPQNCSLRCLPLTISQVTRLLSGV